MTDDTEVLDGLSEGELEALAEGLLVPSRQFRLDELIARSKEIRLSGTEEADLDSLLTRVDQLRLLKTRARYTLQRQAGGQDGIVSRSKINCLTENK